MKLLALILAFAAYADTAHAQPTVADGDALWTLAAVKLDGHTAHAVYALHTPDGNAPAYISVVGCTSGYKLIAITANHVQKLYQWQRNDNTAINLIATDVCKAVAK